jgi:hypothetical protein
MQCWGEEGQIARGLGWATELKEPENTRLQEQKHNQVTEVHFNTNIRIW